MSIVYVDLEHDRVRDNAVAGVAHRTRRAAALARLAEAAGEPCDVVRFEDVTVDLIRSLAPRALVISGNTADWSEYAVASLAGMAETIRAAPVPILGICGGHQLIGQAHGATWGPLGPVLDGATDPHPHFAPGLRKERGFLPIDIDRSSPLFQGLGALPVVFQSHYWHLTDVPPEFSVCASSLDSPIQAIARQDRPVFGVQFHPERYDDNHRDGEMVLRNFFAIARDNLPLPVARPTSDSVGLS